MCFKIQKNLANVDSAIKIEYINKLTGFPYIKHTSSYIIRQYLGQGCILYWWWRYVSSRSTYPLPLQHCTNMQIMYILKSLLLLTAYRREEQTSMWKSWTQDSHRYRNTFHKLSFAMWVIFRWCQHKDLYSTCLASTSPSAKVGGRNTTLHIKQVLPFCLTYVCYTV